MKVTAEQIKEMVARVVKEHLEEGLFDKEKPGEGDSSPFDKNTDEEAPEEKSHQAQAIENKLDKVQGLDTLLDKVKTATQAEEIITSIVASLDSVEKQHIEQGLQRVLRTVKNGPEADVQEEGGIGIGSRTGQNGGMSSASMGGPVLSEIEDMAGYNKGLQDAVKETNSMIELHAGLKHHDVVAALEGLRKIIKAKSSTAETQRFTQV